MRTPWYICLLLMICSVGGTWYFRTKEMNFFPEVVTLPDTALGGEEVVVELPPAFIGPAAPKPLPQELYCYASSFVILKELKVERHEASQLPL